MEIPYQPIDEKVYELFYFSKYALSIYGAIPYNLLAHHKLLDLFKKIDETQNFLENLNLDDADLRFSYLKAKKYLPAHAVSLDHEKQAVVLTIRGTFSVFDCITDIEA